jgi:hypothetical protein
VELAERLAEALRGGRPADLLDGWAAGLTTRWRTLLTPGSGFAAGASATPWVCRHVARLPECVPAAGQDLERLLAQIGVLPSDESSGGP